LSLFVLKCVDAAIVMLKTKKNEVLMTTTISNVQKYSGNNYSTYSHAGFYAKPLNI